MYSASTALTFSKVQWSWTFGDRDTAFAPLLAEGLVLSFTVFGFVLVVVGVVATRQRDWQMLAFLHQLRGTEALKEDVHWKNFAITPAFGKALNFRDIVIIANNSASQKVLIHWSVILFDKQIILPRPVNFKLSDVVNVRARLQVWPNGLNQPLFPGSSIENVLPPPPRNEQGEALVNGQVETDEHIAAINSVRIVEGEVHREYKGVTNSMPNFQLGSRILKDLERMKEELE